MGFADKADGYIATYSIAGIGVQNPIFPTRNFLFLSMFASDYTGLGLAKVTNAQMTTPHGERIGNRDNQRGFGLGMGGRWDQLSPIIAVEAMKERIQLRTEMCDDKCTSTDIFLAAALGQNGPGFTPDNMSDLLGAKDYTPRSEGGTHSLNWAKWLNNPLTSPGDIASNKSLIAQFAGNVLYLQDQGWDVPNDIDWVYVHSLTVSEVQP